MLLLARDENGAPMTDRELRDELVTLLVAGHETTATVARLDLRAAQPQPAASRTQGGGGRHAPISTRWSRRSCASGR